MGIIACCFYLRIANHRALPHRSSSSHLLPLTQIQGADKPEFLTSMDLHEDACIIINAEGKILIVNAVSDGKG